MPTVFKGPQLLLICFVFLVLFNFPFISIFNVEKRIWGIPLLYGYVHLLWLLVIALLYGYFSTKTVESSEEGHD